jgi:hypothetical protein
MEEDKSNEFRYCQKCGKRMQQQHTRVDKNIVIRTRKCQDCKIKGIHTIEMPLSEYNRIVDKYNRILDIIQDHYE